MVCYDGFGNLADGRPIWRGDFNGDGKAEVLFFYPGDGNWWLATLNSQGQFDWSLVSNTTGFGNITSLPKWVGDFNGNGKSDVLFYYGGDGNWWLGSHDGSNQFSWNLVSNTGRPYRSFVRLHLKILQNPINFTTQQMIDGIREVYATANIRVDWGTTENLNLPLLLDLDVGNCIMGQTTNEQNDLFNNQNNVGDNDVVVYFVRSTVPAFNGCAAHPNGRPGCVVTQGASRWTLAHEVGHVLGLNHVDATGNCLLDRLMTGCGTGSITNPPPDLVANEVQTMQNSNLSVDC